MNEGVEEDYKHPQLAYSSGSPIEFDIFIEALKLVIEYQGEQHFRPIYSNGIDFEEIRNRDEEKRRACKQVHWATVSDSAAQHHVD